MKNELITGFLCLYSLLAMSQVGHFRYIDVKDSITSKTTNTDLVLIGKGTGKVSIEGNYSLPETDGTTGQVMLTNGAGVLSFGSAPSPTIIGIDGVLFYDNLTLTTNIPAKNLSYISQVGSGFTYTHSVPSIAANSFKRVSVVEQTNDQLRMYDFNGSTWSLVGSGFTIGTVVTPALAAHTATRTSFTDQNNDQLIMFNFNEGTGTWSIVGSGFALGTVINPALAAHTATRVSFIEENSGILKMYDFGGSTWSQVGSDFAITPFVGNPSLAAHSATLVSFIDGTLQELRMYEFTEGTGTWSLVGSGLSIVCTNPSITALSENRVILIDSFAEVLKIFDFNGSTWSQVGPTLPISGLTFPKLAANSSNNFSLIDDTIDQLRFYKIDINLNTPPSPAFD